MNPRDKEFEAKKESNPPEFVPARINSRQWSSSFKNPRIVRVSRSFGGKDRHSKVCTVRGLRDRRIRLSVPTAIQLYDLQDRLGLSQPSKVVDWLIDAAKHEIDKLPPLPIIPSHLIPSSHHSSSSLSNLLVPPNVEPYTKGGTTMKMDQDEEGFNQGASFNFFPMPNMPYSNPNFFHWDPSNLSLSQFGGGYNSFASQADESTSHFYTTTVPSIIPPYIPQPMENDYFRHINNQNPPFPTTLHFIGRPSHENQSPKQDNKD